MIAPIPTYPSSSDAECFSATLSGLIPALPDTLQAGNCAFENDGLTHGYNEHELTDNYLSAALDLSTVISELAEYSPLNSLVPPRPSTALQWDDLPQTSPHTLPSISNIREMEPFAISPDAVYPPSASESYNMEATAPQDPLRDLEFLLGVGPYPVTTSTTDSVTPAPPEELSQLPTSSTPSRPGVPSPYPVLPLAGPSKTRSNSPPSTSVPHISRRRNIHVSSSVVPVNEWACPHCPHVQHNQRKPDLRRHIATHTKPTQSRNARWTCCGVPLTDVGKHEVPERVLHEQPMVVHEGVAMVGGCLKTFTRKDALLRHLRVRKGMCFGDASAEWHVGNRAKQEV
ncbi:hypothetical protein L226DRAFT_272619 [Lentinus tigrinus ALCF2SS1-7]|uniref:Uncharacterized protein n=1 Tax=Lentinus tigrinus ALCF2SS1-6 TaxID=1328759 RepID=A0A5C2SAY7_9APHY|nr:hypothetical protein L227DRAFT_97664 [Lentinus tigrinus ALCF2SS1-6]RPD69562.1 hypothetical protein L226DRAFT_272619 [Lentinus tigrinus ALCF2SS1-7]